MAAKASSPFHEPMGTHERLRRRRRVQQVDEDDGRLRVRASGPGLIGIASQPVALTTGFASVEIHLPAGTTDPGIVAMRSED